MKLGYIHSNREEQTRVMQVLKMTSESVALDELGIGRIRDAFADRMFPGISTLQKHMPFVGGKSGNYPAGTHHDKESL